MLPITYSWHERLTCLERRLTAETGLRSHKCLPTKERLRTSSSACGNTALTVAFWRHFNGLTVDLEKIPTHVWNTDEFREWLIDCKAPATIIHRYWHPLANVPDYLLYIERESLEAVIAAVDELRRPVQTIAGQTACQKWLLEEILASRNRRTGTKEYFLRLAKEKFDDISERSFNTAWANAVRQAGAPAWSGAGRPRKSPH